MGELLLAPPFDEVIRGLLQIAGCHSGGNAGAAALPVLFEPTAPLHACRTAALTRSGEALDVAASRRVPA